MMVLKIYPEAVIWRCSVEKVFLETSQNSKKNNFARVSFFFAVLRPATLHIFYRIPLVVIFDCLFVS